MLHLFDDIDCDTVEDRNRFDFYRILWNASDGNPMVALHLWTDSLRIAPDNLILVSLPQLSATSELEKVLETPEPEVHLHTLGESSVDFVVRPWVNPMVAYGKVEIISCNNSQYHSDSAIFWISLQVNSSGFALRASVFALRATPRQDAETRRMASILPYCLPSGKAGELQVLCC